MKKAALHTFSIGLALVVLFSTFSFTVHKHYCGKSLVGQGIFSSARLCKSEINTCSAEKAMLMDEGENSCCSDKKENIKGQDELKFSSFSIDLSSPHFLMPEALQFTALVNEVSLKAIPDLYYKPPLLVVDIHIIDQVFLI